MDGDTCAEGIFKADDSLLRTSACFYDWGNSIDKVPAIQLELSDTEEVALKEAIVVKNENTQNVLEARFVPQAASNRLDREIQNKQLANLLQFYLDRCRRHGLIDPDLAEAADIQHVIRAVTEGSFEVEFEKAGYIYNLQGASKEPERYEDNRIFIIGNDTIRELLDIPPDVEAPPVEVTEPEVAVPPAPPNAPPKPVLQAAAEGGRMPDSHQQAYVYDKVNFLTMPPEIRSPVAAAALAEIARQGLTRPADMLFVILDQCLRDG